MYKKLAKYFLILNILIIAFVFVKGFSSTWLIDKSKDSYLINNVNNYSVLKGKVVKEREELIDKQRLIVDINGEKILITCKMYPQYSYGDYLEISGLLLKPENFDNFNYEAYLSRYDIFYLMYYPKINKLENINLSLAERVYKKIILIKQSIRRVINIGLPEPCAGIANSIILGYKKSLSNISKDIFSKTGLSHLMAISGAHISILTAIILSFCLNIGLSRKFTNRIILMFLIFFPIFTGLSSSAIRASIMGVLSLMALSANRLKLSLNSLIFTATVMIVFNPLILHHDIGFQLSFLAVLGIIYLNPIFENIKNNLIKKSRIRYFKKIINTLLSFFNISLSAQLFCLPIIALNFNEVSCISPLSNILVIWIFPMLFSFLLIAIVLSFIFPPLIYIYFLPSYICINYIYQIAQSLARFNFVIKVDRISPLFLILYYSILFVFIKIYGYKNKKKDILYKKSTKKTRM